MAADVWMRPCVSVFGTRWTRCPPLSYRRCWYTPSPATLKTTSLNPPASPGLNSISSTFQPWVRA